MPQWDWVFLALLLASETALSALVIAKVPYTEIDWIAYMEEVDCWWKDSEYDYKKIYGNTGPLVYPAGFLYLFRVLQWLTDGQIPKAQYFFLAFYVVTQAVVLILYTLILREIRAKATIMEESTSTSTSTATSTSCSRRKTTTTTSSNISLSSCNQVWSFRIAMGCLCLSKRFHSIFLLRLFNDGPTMLVAYVSFWCFMNHKWNLGCFVFSLAVSLKMNVLLFSPGLLYLLIQASLPMTIPRLAICGITQLILGAPFLLRHPVSYLRKAFELDRQFFFKWTVNFKFLSEEVFLSKKWAVFLLLLHLTLLGVYFYRLYKTSYQKHSLSLSAEHILSTLFISNFIGICCARTLHYQFYSWYFSALPLLLWRQTMYPFWIRLLLLGGIEYAFITFPATPLSSMVLQLAHWSIVLPCVFQQQTEVEEDGDYSSKTKQN